MTNLIPSLSLNAMNPLLLIIILNLVSLSIWAVWHQKQRWRSWLSRRQVGYAAQRRPDRWKEFAEFEPNSQSRTGSTTQVVGYRTVLLTYGAMCVGAARTQATQRSQAEKRLNLDPVQASEKTGPIRGRHCKLESIPRKELEGGKLGDKRNGSMSAQIRPGRRSARPANPASPFAIAEGLPLPRREQWIRQGRSLESLTPRPGIREQSATSRNPARA